MVQNSLAWSVFATRAWVPELTRSIPDWRARLTITKFSPSSHRLCSLDCDHTASIACQETAMLFVWPIVECRQALLCWVCTGYAIPSWVRREMVHNVSNGVGVGGGGYTLLSDVREPLLRCYANKFQYHPPNFSTRIYATVHMVLVGCQNVVIISTVGCYWSHIYHTKVLQHCRDTMRAPALPGWVAIISRDFKIISPENPGLMYIIIMPYIPHSNPNGNLSDY